MPCRKKIYFDGYLPPSKRDTRTSRLVNYTRLLANYHEAWPQIIPATPKSTTIPHGEPILFGGESAPSGLTKIPAVPYLVPSIIEALSRSWYQQVVEVIPGEADLYCARHVKQHGGTVLTSDSDLLVHDLGLEGAVSFLKDIEVVTTRNTVSVRCVQYKIAAIAKRLGITAQQNLRHLAFEMTMDPHATFPQLLQKVTKFGSEPSNRNLYREFALQYSPLAPEEVVAAENTKDPVRAVLARLDPRVSEYVLQFPRFAQIASLPEGPDQLEIVGQRDVAVFLPFISDFPLRTSAWEMSTSIRQLAYGMVNLAVPEDQKISSIFEHRRQQAGTKGREWQIPTTLLEIEQASVNLLGLLKCIRQTSPNLLQESMWRTLALYQDLDWSTGSGKSSLGQQLIQASKNDSGSNGRLTWETLHFTAQIHGSYYSFRTLKQILDVVLSTDPSPEVLSLLLPLRNELDSLPSLDTISSVSDATTGLGNAEDKSLLAIALKVLGQETKQQKVLEKKESKAEKKKRKRANETNGPEVSQKKKPTNPFDVLSRDD
jgi:hypothetical protein